MIKLRGIKEKGGDLFKVLKRYYFFLKLNEGGVRIQFLEIVKQKIGVELNCMNIFNLSCLRIVAVVNISQEINIYFYFMSALRI
jgi:hypothetical protein